MGKYGKCAVNAVKIFVLKKIITPNEAWELSSVAEFGKGSSSQKKGCPRDAFLGLCENGNIKGIPVGKYTKSKKNKSYALGAVQFLKKHPKLVWNPLVIWNYVTSKHSIVHNQQMDVVIDLFKNGLLV